MVSSPRPRPRSLALHLADVEAVGDVRDRLQQFVSQQTGWEERVRVSALGKERLEQLAQGILMFKLLMGAFTAISLLVGGVGIMNVLLASILERTREIGVRKAVGARRRDVLWQFLIESVTISAAGTTVGLALGIAGAFGVTAIIRAQTDASMYAAWTWQTGAVAAVAAMTIGMLAGLYPAVRAARLTPLDAIQRE
jgi:putative ABC transport system permease protein